MAVAEEQAIPNLIAADEPAAYEVIHADTDRPVLLTCDHASRRIPRSLGSLGLEDRYLDDHIAWDIGAGAVAGILCRRLGCGAVVGNYSRLVVDLNRGLGDSTVIPAISDGVLIPGNLGLDETHRAQRVGALFTPYHEAVRRQIATLTSVEQWPVVINIHSFTPSQHGLDRGLDVGVLWDTDARLPVPLMARLRTNGDIRVGDNLPYSGRHPADFTIDHHAESRGLAHAGIEICQDLIADSQGQSRWGARLADVLENVLGDARLYRPNPIALEG